MAIAQTPQEHYEEAEAYLHQAKSENWDDDTSVTRLSLQVAQVHAQLACAPNFNLYKDSGIFKKNRTPEFGEHHKTNAPTTDKTVAPNAGLEHLGEDFI